MLCGQIFRNDEPQYFAKKHYDFISTENVMSEHNIRRCFSLSGPIRSLHSTPPLTRASGPSYTKDAATVPKYLDASGGTTAYGVEPLTIVSQAQTN